MTILNLDNAKYVIHGFMFKKLGLSGTELITFSIIYSFTYGGVGFFFGTQQYISELGGISQSSVKRAVKKLLARGYIERVSMNGRDGFRSTEIAVPSYPNSIYTAENTFDVVEDYEPESTADKPAVGNSISANGATVGKAISTAEKPAVGKSISTADDVGMGKRKSSSINEVNKDAAKQKKPSQKASDGKPRINFAPTNKLENWESKRLARLSDQYLASLPSQAELYDEGVTASSLISKTDPLTPARYRHYEFGKEGVVFMTSDQYRRLLDLVESDTLQCYIIRLEHLILEKGYRTFSAYKTIKRWIDEDTRV